MGCVEYCSANLDSAESLLTEAVSILDRRGDSWFRMFFYHNLRHLHGIRGSIHEELQCALTELQIAQAVNEPEGLCWGLYGQANALARGGNTAEAQNCMTQVMELLDGRTNIIVVPTALQTLGFVQLQASDYGAARNSLEKSCRLLRNEFAFVDYSIRSYPLLVEALLGPRWFVPGAAVNADVRRAWRLSRWALFWSWSFPNYRPHAWRSRGRATWARRKRAAAIRCFERAIECAERIGARYDLARAYLDLAEVDHHRRDECRTNAARLLTELNSVVPQAEMDRAQ
jgi:tetratricopeptide (TPR) repeat protein